MDKILYLKLETTMNTDDRQKYYEKLRVYQVFYPMITRIGDTVIVEYEPNKRQTMTNEEYIEYRKDNLAKLSKSTVRMIVKINDFKQGYLYSAKDDTIKDEIDDNFINNYENYNKMNNDSKVKKMEFYGLHTYGGYRLFFRPDLNEVINLLSTKVSIKELNNVQRIYVTTEPHPSDNINDCYDSETDTHKAITTCFIYYNDNKDKDNDNDNDNKDDDHRVKKRLKTM